MQEIENSFKIAIMHGKSPEAALQIMRDTACNVIKDSEYLYIQLDEAKMEKDKGKPYVFEDFEDGEVRHVFFMFFSEEGVQKRIQEYENGNYFKFAKITKEELLNLCKIKDRKKTIFCFETYEGNELNFSPEELIPFLSETNSNKNSRLHDFWYVGRYSQERVTANRFFVLTLIVIFLGHCFILGKPDCTIKNGVLDKYRGKNTVEVLNQKGSGFYFRKIDYRAFEHKNNRLEELEIKDGLEEIEFYGISNCPYLKTLKLPETLKEIDGQGIYNCPKLEEIEIPKSVSVIGGKLFSGCDSLRHITIGENLYKYYGQYFSDLIDKVEFTFSDDSETFCEENFYTFKQSYDGSLSMILDSYPFEELIVPEGVQSLSETSGSKSFINLKKVILPQSLNRISCTFINSSLVEITIPDSVTSLPYDAFYNCTQLKKVILGKGITEIESSSFKQCSSLEEVIVSENMEYISDSAFKDSKNVKIIYEDGRAYKNNL